MGHIAYRIPDDLHTRAKLAAVRRGIPLKAWLEQAIAAQLAREENDDPRRR